MHHIIYSLSHICVLGFKVYNATNSIHKQWLNGINVHLIKAEFKNKILVLLYVNHWSDAVIHWIISISVLFVACIHVDLLKKKYWEKDWFLGI